MKNQTLLIANKLTDCKYDLKLYRYSVDQKDIAKNGQIAMEFHYSKYKTVCSAVQICRFCGSGNDLNTTLGLSLRFE